MTAFNLSQQTTPAHLSIQLTAPCWDRLTDMVQHLAAHGVSDAPDRQGLGLRPKPTTHNPAGD